MVALTAVPITAQTITLKGIGHNNRYDDGDQMKSSYLGYNNDLGKAIFLVDNGIYAMTSDGTTVSTPERTPAIVKEEVMADNAKQLWVSNFNMMYGNSGAAYINGKLVTVMSRDESSTVDEELFAVRKWDASTGNLLSTEIRNKSDRLESAGMSYNPKDGKVYGLFYMTGQDLPTEITSDPDYFEDQDADMTDGDAGYCLCTIDLATMKLTPITPGLYYYNFITFAINSDGRAFALTSGGIAAPEDSDGKLRDMDGNLAGAQLYEIDLNSGLLKLTTRTTTDKSTGESYTEEVSTFPATGYSSQYSRQAACFAKSNPNKMYWVGYYNSGKGYNEYGSWGSLPDREWRTNGKYDTALYEIDITTGETTRVAKIPNRWIFSALWVDGDDPSDGAEVDPFNPGEVEPIEGTYIALSHAENGSIWQQAEIGKTYTYYLEPAEGWTLHSVTFNDTELDIAEGNFVTTPAVSAAHSRLIVTFEQSPVAGVRSAQDGQSQVRVLGTAHGIRVVNAQAGDVVNIFTADGSKVCSQSVNSQQTDIALAPHTLYIIKVGEKVVKVRL